MELSDLLASAWAAVEKSGVPTDQRSVAFREAIAILRENGESPLSGGLNGARKAAAGKKAAAPSRGRATTPAAGNGSEIKVPSESDFFTRLAEESGVSEDDLRDVLQLTSTGDVHVTPATRKLGDSKQKQTQTIAALVAGARAYGLLESPIDGKKVRTEVQRKNCYDRPNYSSKHLAGLKGLNKGGTGDTLVLTSKWIDDFKPAVNQALGRSGDGD